MHGEICEFCNSSQDEELKLGKIYSFNGLKVHYFCMLLSSNLCQSGQEKEGILGFMPYNIKKEINRARQLKCTYCKQRGASIGCCYKKCPKTFHLLCGIREKCINQFFGRYESFCNVHAPKQVHSQKESSCKTNICAICCDKVKTIPDYDNIVATCCQNGCYHRDCILKLAKSSGYHFFKCPLCNNKDEFIHEMQRLGVYIPDQDASWELEPHAFDDLLYKYDKCDSEYCKCPWGRNYDQYKTDWSLMLCKCCGSSGIHRGCRDMKRKVYYCILCFNVVHPRKQTRRSNATYQGDSFHSDKSTNGADSSSDCDTFNSSNMLSVNPLIYSVSNKSQVHNKHITGDRRLQNTSPYILRPRK